MCGCVLLTVHLPQASPRQPAEAPVDAEAPETAKEDIIEPQDMESVTKDAAPVSRPNSEPQDTLTTTVNISSYMSSCSRALRTVCLSQDVSPPRSLHPLGFGRSLTALPRTVRHCLASPLKACIQLLTIQICGSSAGRGLDPIEKARLAGSKIPTPTHTPTHTPTQDCENEARPYIELTVEPPIEDCAPDSTTVMEDDRTPIFDASESDTDRLRAELAALSTQLETRDAQLREASLHAQPGISSVSDGVV